jgi:hypothetical protein
MNENNSLFLKSIIYIDKHIRMKLAAFIASSITYYPI